MTGYPFDRACLTSSLFLSFDVLLTLNLLADSWRSTGGLLPFDQSISVNPRVPTGLKPRTWIESVLRKFFLSQILMDTLHELLIGQYNVLGYFFL